MIDGIGRHVIGGWFVHVSRLFMFSFACLLAAALGLTVPASAEDVSTQVSAIDTSTPGHANGTVTTDAPYVRTWVQAGSSESTRIYGSVAADTHTVAFDHPTWGLQSPTYLRVQSCLEATASSCGAATWYEFTPSDVEPEVTWSDLDRVGFATPPYVISVSDPDGDDSLLKASFNDGPLEPVDRFGETTLTFPGHDGTGVIELWRCTPSGYPCAPTGVVSPELTVHLHLLVRMYQSSPSPLRPNDDPSPDQYLSVCTDYLDTYVLDWWIETPVGDVVSGVGEAGMTHTFGHGDCEFLGIDLTGLGSGKYSLVVRLTRNYEGFGVLTGTNRESIDIDVTPPLGEVTASTNSLYPVPDGFRDSVNIALGITEDPVDAKLEILNHDGLVIRTLHDPSSDGHLTWHGRTDAGEYAPEGQYSFRATLTDSLGNASVYTGGAVTLSWKKLVTHTFKKTIAAGSSLSRSTVGACSTLKRPSNRGWAGSLGLYSNIKCSESTRASRITTIHRLRVPTATRYGTFTISAYGGAARSRPTSVAYLDQRNTSGEWGARDTRLGAGLGAHSGPTRNASSYLSDDHAIVWSAHVAAGNRYDLKSFTVTMTYEVLQ